MQETDYQRGDSLRLGYEMPGLSGARREEWASRHLSDEEYIRYRGMRVASRITVPLTSLAHIKNAAMAFRHLARELDKLYRDAKRPDIDRVYWSQLACTGTGQRLKHEALLREEYASSIPGTYRNVR